MTPDMLKREMNEAVIKRLSHYVYRLIDPRNGETFYVGVGRGRRVLDHVLGEKSYLTLNSHDDEDYDDDASLKLLRIKRIKDSGLQVIHIIHRHGIADAETARLVEAALIDAYPGLGNKQLGHGSGYFGCRSLEEIIVAERMDEFEVTEPLILISIGKSFVEDESSVYENTRFAWRASRTNAEKYKLVVAHSAGVVRGVFRPETWLDATLENFPGLAESMPGRIGFEGVQAEDDVRRQYMNRRVPDRLRMKGAANPFRYVEPE